MKLFYTSSNYTTYAGRYGPDLIFYIINEQDWTCYVVSFNDPSGRILEAALSSAARKKNDVSSDLTTYLCQSIVEERSAGHLKRLNQVLKQYASTVPSPFTQKSLIKGADICYGDDVQLALDLIKVSATSPFSKSLFFGIHSNNFAISLPVSKEAMDDKLRAFIEKLEMHLPNLEALWPYFQAAHRRFSGNGAFKNSVNLL